MIQSPNKDTYFLLKDPQTNPKLIKVNNITLKIVLYLAPIIFLIALVSSYFIYKVFSYRLDMAKKENQAYSQELQEKNELLISEIENLKNNQLDLQKKISLGSSEKSQFNIFSQTLGFQDLTANGTATVELDVDKVKDGKIYLNFGLTNNTKPKKLSGYIFAIQYSKNKISIYPDLKEQNEQLSIDYFRGDSFTISRFKNTLITFDVIDNEFYYYRFLVFSKTGDLITNKKFGPINPKNFADKKL
jgi:hypothetical protein